MTSQHSPRLLSLLLGQAQTTLNRWIAQSTAATEETRGLEGRAMVVAVEDTNLRILLRVEQQQLRLQPAADGASGDIEIRAGLFDLAALLRAESLTQLRAGEIEFRGSLRVADGFARLLRLARPQLEDELAGWIGGLPARALVQSGDAVLAWGTRTASALERDAAEFMQAEARELPRPRDVATFMRDVERLRDDVERIGQRIDHLARGVPSAGSK